jgi:hypothetical protein
MATVEIKKDEQVKVKITVVNTVNDIKIKDPKDYIYQFGSKGEFFGVMYMPTKDVYVLKDYALNEEEFVKRNNYILYYCNDKGKILMISNKKNNERIIKLNYIYVEQSVKKQTKREIMNIINACHQN